MLLLAALPAGAASADGFTDSAEITHVEAVRMLTDLGLLSGYSDGSFRPDVPVTRAQIAKLIALLSTEDPAAAQAAGFADVAESSWALSYIDYCAAQGIVSGSGGLFRPDDPVTALELCKMLLVVLGNDAARYTGAGWAENVRTDADSSHLLRDFSGSVSAAVTRENACLLILNALQNPAIHGFDEDGNALYVLDELRNPRTYLEIRFDAVRYSGVVAGDKFITGSLGGILVAELEQLHELVLEEHNTGDLALFGSCVGGGSFGGSVRSGRVGGLCGGLSLCGLIGSLTGAGAENAKQHHDREQQCDGLFHVSFLQFFIPFPGDLLYFAAGYSLHR